MQKLFNFSSYALTGWFNGNWQEVEDFCQQHNFNGVELLVTGLDRIDIDQIPVGLIKGLHLSYQLDWLPINKEVALDEVVNKYCKELEIANKLDVEYVVFHAASSPLADLFSEEFTYDDRFILNKVAQVINELVIKSDLNCQLLFENLWWSGLRLLDPEAVINFFSNIDYQNTGILLDTGHLLHNNLELKSEKEAINYICQTLKEFKTNLGLFSGIHLHQSLSGAYQRQHRSEVKDKFYTVDTLKQKERLVGEYIGQIDRHLPFTESPAPIIELAKPDYLIYEFTAYNKKDFINYLQIQDNILS